MNGDIVKTSKQIKYVAFSSGKSTIDIIIHITTHCTYCVLSVCINFVFQNDNDKWVQSESWLLMIMYTIVHTM